MKKISFLICVSLFCLNSANLFANEKALMNQSNTQEPPDDTFYYEYSSIVAGKDIDAEGNVMDESNIFQLDEEGKVEIAIGLFNDEPLLTTIAYIEIFSSEGDLVEEFSISPLKPEWNWVKFNVTFNKVGSYTIDVYNEVDAFINSIVLDVVK